MLGFVSFNSLFDGLVAVHTMQLRWSCAEICAPESREPALQCSAVLEERRRFASDFLILELALAAWFWLPYPLSRVLDAIWDRWPLLGLMWFGVWIATPTLTLVGLLMVPRALRTRGGWAQVLVGSLLAATIWYQVSRMEF